MKSWFRRPAPALTARYDPEAVTPVLLCSICTGEQTAGFKDRQTGKFISVMKVSSPKDLDDFRRQYGISGDIPKIY